MTITDLAPHRLMIWTEVVIKHLEQYACEGETEIERIYAIADKAVQGFEARFAPQTPPSMP